MQYMIVETFRGGRPQPVYARFRAHGRLAPPRLHYVGSWVSQTGDRCYQIMECDDQRPLDEWIARWADLIDFEVIPVMTSADAQAVLAPKL